MQTAIVAILGLTSIILGLLSMYTSSKVGSVIDSIFRATGAFFLILGLVLLIFSIFIFKQDKDRECLESEAIEKFEDGYKLYISGYLENNMNMNGIDLKDYIVPIDKDEIYSKEKY